MLSRHNSVGSLCAYKNLSYFTDKIRQAVNSGEDCCRIKPQFQKYKGAKLIKAIHVFKELNIYFIRKEELNS